jgi:hypothetical protein
MVAFHQTGEPFNLTTSPNEQPLISAIAVAASPFSSEMKYPRNGTMQG